MAAQLHVIIFNAIFIVFLVITLINLTRCEDDINSSTKQQLISNYKNNNSDTRLSKTSSSMHTSWWESTISNVRHWLVGAESKSADAAVSESRTFGKIKRLQFALLPIMFKFGVLSTLVGSLVVLALKTIFLLKALFIVNLAVIFGKFFTWKTELLKNHNGGGGGWGHGSWGPPPPPTFYHSSPPIIHSPPIIEAPHSSSSSDAHKEIHVHVHTNKEEKESHSSSWTPHHHHEGYHEFYGAPSNKHISYSEETARSRRNSALTDKNKKKNNANSNNNNNNNSNLKNVENNIKPQTGGTGRTNALKSALQKESLPRKSQGLFFYNLNKNGQGNFKRV